MKDNSTPAAPAELVEPQPIQIHFSADAENGTITLPIASFETIAKAIFTQKNIRQLKDKAQRAQVQRAIDETFRSAIIMAARAKLSNS